MAGLNKCEFIGNMTADAEGRMTQAGKQTCSFSLGVNKTWTDANGQKQQKAEFVRCIAWEKKAELIMQYCKKGTQLYVETEMQTRSWEQDGTKHYTTEFIVKDMVFLGSATGGATQAPAQGQGAPKTEPHYEPANQAPRTQQQAPKAQGGYQQSRPPQQGGYAQSRPPQQAAAPAPQNQPPQNFEDDCPF
jgi:single-strand DNA-binding protein